MSDHPILAGSANGAHDLWEHSFGIISLLVYTVRNACMRKGDRICAAEHWGHTYLCGSEHRHCGAIDLADKVLDFGANEERDKGGIRPKA